MMTHELDRWRRGLKRGDKILGVQLRKDPPRVEGLDLEVISPGRKNCVVKLRGIRVTLPWADLYPAGTDISGKYRVISPVEKTTDRTERARAFSAPEPAVAYLGEDNQLEAKDMEDLTNWRKDLRRGDEILYKSKGGNRTRLAKITDVQGRGCGVSFKGENGGTFAYWVDIFPASQETLEALCASPTKGAATIGDALKTKGVDLRVVPRPADAANPRGERAALTSLPSMVRQMPKEDLPKGATSLGTMSAKLPEPKTPEPPPARTVKRPEGRAAHELTAIAIALRTERIRRGHTQRDASLALGLPYSALSKLELGVDEPDDDVLMAYVDHYNMDLYMLLRLRDGQTESAPAKVELVAPIAPPTVEEIRALVAPEPPSIVPPSKAEDQLDWFLEFTDFTERLKLAIPFPADVVKRRAWYKAAQKMFEIHNGN